MSDAVIINVRVNDQTVQGFRDVNGRLRTLSGQYARAADDMQRSSSKANGAITGLKSTLLSLAPAAVPVAASLAPIAVHAGAAGLAVAAFGAAVGPQIGNLKDAAQAQTKYSNAVQQYGAHSKQAAQAQQQVAQTLGAMPKATQRAAAGYMTLKDQFKHFSDSTAKFTMVPVEKSFAVLGQVIPKLTPMVKGTSEQFSRLMDVAGGGVSTAAFDTLSKKVSDFANSALKGATDKAIHFMRVLSEGNAHGPIASFFEYARAQGPAVKELLTNVAQAVSNLLEGALQAGPGLLTLVNAFAKLVASVPPSLIANLMQVYAAFKLIKLAGAGVGVIAGNFATLGTRVAALRAASVAAGGGIAGMNAALNTLSTGGKAALALGVVGGLALAMHKLSDNKAPVAVDELSTSLNTLASTGKVTGTLSTNFDEMTKSIAMMSKGASGNKFLQMASDFGTWVGIAKGPSISDATKNLDAWDKVMANNVRAGNPKLAAAQFEILKKSWKAGGGDLNRLKKFTNDYNNALADQKFEQQMAAESMGIFGTAAQAAQTKLDAQKQSADGLRQSIQALSEAHRSAYDAQTKFEAAIDNATKSIKDNGKTLDVSSEKGRANRDALSQLAAATEDAAAKARDNNAAWSTVQGIYDKGRKSIIDNATAITGNRKEAEKLASTLLTMPSPKMRLEMRTDDAIRNLNSVIGALKKTPGHKNVTVKALTDDAVSMLRDLGFKVTKLKDGRFKVSANTKSAKDALAAVESARDGLKNKTITLAARDRASGAIREIQRAIAALHSKSVTITTVREVISKYNTIGRPSTGEGGVSKYAEGGPVLGGSGTQDDVPILAMGGEFMVNKNSTRKHRRLLEAINDDKLPGFARGGSVTKSEKQARHDAMPNLTVSHFGQMAGYKRSEFGSALAKPDSLGSLVNSLNEWRHMIEKMTHGATESKLLKALDSTGKKLLTYEKQLNSVNASLGKAKDKLNTLKDSASQLASSVKSGILGSANITRGASGDAPVTVSSIMGGLTQSRDKATAFASALKELQKKGLSASLIQQIAEAGIEGGGLETAGALLGASSSEIKSVNSLQGQINTAATSAGKTTADSVYAAAIKMQERTVKELTRQQAKLTTAMDKLTKAMEKAIEKAIGKKAAGGIVGAAASGGIRSGLTWVGEHGPELADLPVGSRVWSNPDSRRKAQAPWASMLNEPRGGGVRRAATPVGGGPVEVLLELRSSGSETDEFLLKILRRAIRVRGGNAQVVLTGRTS